MGFFDWFKQKKQPAKPAPKRAPPSPAANKFTVIRIDVDHDGYGVLTRSYYGPGPTVWWYTNGPGTLQGEVRARTRAEATAKIAKKTRVSDATFEVDEAEARSAGRRRTR